MSRSIKIVFAFLVVALQTSIAQGVTDAVRWSVFSPGGTARTLGVAGSFGAMGGDFSVININPAGMAEYKRGEFTITPSVTSTVGDAYFSNNPTAGSSYRASRFGLDNVGIVIANPRQGTWKSSNFSFGFSKIADLNKNFRLEGKTTGSITQRFIEQANGKILDELDDFEAWPAFKTGAIYDLNEDLNYEADIYDDEANVKTQIVNQKGSINEFSFGWAGNYDNKLNIGVSVGMPLISFDEFKQYEEDDPLDEVPYFNNLQYNESLTTTGYGLNFKVGFIYNLQKYFRLGAALHSPTWYTLNDDYYTDLTYSYYDNGINESNYRSPDGSFKYKLNTPWRAVGSVGSIYSFGKVKGFVNADVEWVDYTSNKFNFVKYSSDPSESGYENQINNQISQTLGSSLNFRLGTELALGKLRLRVGTERAKSPYVDQKDRITTNSFGLGFRENNFFFDVAFQKRTYLDSYQPYVLDNTANSQVANVDLSKNRVVFTAGFKF